MKSYRVTWDIDLEADSPEEAARLALDIQRDAESTATCFEVYEHQNISVNPVLKIDLGEDK